MTFHSEGLHSIGKYMAMWNSETNKQIRLKKHFVS